MSVLVTAAQMRMLDQHTIEKIGIPALVLMENAGRSIAEEVYQFARQHGSSKKSWIALVGKGHNGADAIVATRHLLEFGISVHLCYVCPQKEWAANTKLQGEIANQIGIPSFYLDDTPIQFQTYAGVLDGLLGTGSKGAPKQRYAQLIEAVNHSGLPVVSIDIPSGLDADTGTVASSCIQASLTVTLAFMKRGLVQYPGKKYAGDVIVRNIGIPSTLPAQLSMDQVRMGNKMELIKRYGVQIPPTRPDDAHKGSCGHVLAIAGSIQYSGAGWLAAKAALRGGCGLVSWALPQSLRQNMIGNFPEAILIGIEDQGQGDWSLADPKQVAALAEKKQAVVIGPGLGRFKDDAAWLKKVVQQIHVPVVIDADALNMLADQKGMHPVIWKTRNKPVVLTPHPGEMARLLGTSVQHVQSNRIKVAQSYAMQHGVVLVLKGAATVTATPSGEVFVNTTGNAGMATGGAGDVLAGLIASFIAQGLEPEAAAAIGVYMHGEAGDRAAALRPNRSASILASDIIDSL